MVYTESIKENIVKLISIKSAYSSKEVKRNAILSAILPITQKFHQYPKGASCKILLSFALDNTNRVLLSCYTVCKTRK